MEKSSAKRILGQTPSDNKEIDARRELSGRQDARSNQVRRMLRDGCGFHCNDLQQGMRGRANWRPKTLGQAQEYGYQFQRTLLIGATPLREVFAFMKEYEKRSGNPDMLYEKNVRKFLGRKRKVNKGIEETLELFPERFGLYNNGIAMDLPSRTKKYSIAGCDSASRK